MADLTNVTARHSWQKIGGSEVIEPALFNAFLDSADAASNGDPHLAADFTLGTGVAFTFERPHGLRALRLTLINLLLTMAGATTSCVANATLLTWPATSNIAIATARMNLTCVKDGTILLAADTPILSVGHAVAALSDLSTANDKSMIDSTALAGTLSSVAQKNGAAAPAYRFVAKGASNIVNLALGLSTKVGGTLLVNGTVDIFYHEFGNFSSLVL